MLVEKVSLIEYLVENNLYVLESYLQLPLNQNVYCSIYSVDSTQKAQLIECAFNNRKRLHKMFERKILRQKKLHKFGFYDTPICSKTPPL